MLAALYTHVLLRNRRIITIKKENGFKRGGLNFQLAQLNYQKDILAGLEVKMFSRKH